MQPARGLLRVRPIDTDETLPGGRIALVAETRERMTAWQCECVATGALAVCEDEDCERTHTRIVCETCAQLPDDDLSWFECGCEHFVHPCAVCPGDWLLVRPRSYIAGPEPERAEWFVHQDDVLAILSED